MSEMNREVKIKRKEMHKILYRRDEWRTQKIMGKRKRTDS